MVFSDANGFISTHLIGMKMSTENGLRVFSLRVPESLAKQIDQRAAVSRRTRNAEIVLLLEQAIDLNVSRDLKLMQEMKQRSQSESHTG